MTYKARITKKKLPTDLPLDGSSITDNGLFQLGVSSRKYWDSLVTNSRYSNQLIYKMRSPKYVNVGGLRNLGKP